MRRVVLYTKSGCHLCEAVGQVIAAVRSRRAFEYAERDITDDPGDFDKYRFEIPVVTVDGVEVARHRMTRGEFERALDERDGGQGR